MKNAVLWSPTKKKNIFVDIVFQLLSQIHTSNKTKKKEFNGYLFVPFKLDNEKNYLKRLEEYLDKFANQNLNKISVRIHPLNQKSKKHIKFKYQCNQILTKYKKKKKK